MKLEICTLAMCMGPTSGCNIWHFLSPQPTWAITEHDISLDVNIGGESDPSVCDMSVFQHRLDVFAKSLLAKMSAGSCMINLKGLNVVQVLRFHGTPPVGVERHYAVQCAPGYIRSPDFIEILFCFSAIFNRN